MLEGGVAWGRGWLGLRLDEEPGWARAGGVASGGRARGPGDVTGGKETDVSRRV